MRNITRLGGLVLAGLIALGCEPMVAIRTRVSPDANLEGLRTFRIMRVPASRSYHRPSALDPMVYNSATNRALQDALREGFEGRGYLVTDHRPDFEVAYYATAREKLDVMVWNYGYHWRAPWWGTRVVTVYREGTVIVDVIDPRTDDLLWRGQGKAVVSNDPREFRKDLRKAVGEIVARFPPARAMIAARGSAAPVD